MGGSLSQLDETGGIVAMTKFFHLDWDLGIPPGNGLLQMRLMIDIVEVV
jgi:hypothetical protein